MQYETEHFVWNAIWIQTFRIHIHFTETTRGTNVNLNESTIYEWPTKHTIFVLLEMCE